MCVECRALICGFAGWGWDGDVEVRDFAEGGQSWLDLGLVADGDDREFRWVDVFVRYASDVGGGDLFYAGFVFFEGVGRVAVEGEGDLFVEGLVGGVVVEDEGVEDLVLGFAEFGGGGWVGLRRSISASMAWVAAYGGYALGRGLDVEDAGVIVGGAEAAADAVGEAEFGADFWTTREPKPPEKISFMTLSA